MRKVVSKVLFGEEFGSFREFLSRGIKFFEYLVRGKKGEKVIFFKLLFSLVFFVFFKFEAKKEVVKDEFFMGLRSLMFRGRGKDYKFRGK